MSVVVAAETASDRSQVLLIELVPLLKGTTDMRNDTRLTEAGRQYAEAYAAHYTGRDLPVALQLYRKVMASHPDAQEAGYSRTQVQNIVNTVVSKQELLDAQIELAVAHF
jgi:hypothetical protein